MNTINYVPAIDISKSTTGCCALIEPKDWDGQIFNFENKDFVKVRTLSFLHIPLNMSFVMKKAQETISSEGADLNSPLILSNDTSPWHTTHLIAVSKRLPNMDMQTLSGTFLAKVFEGPFKDAKKWYGELIDYVTSLGKVPIKTYFFYTTCPRCSKVYDKNYVVGFAQTM